MEKAIDELEKQYDKVKFRFKKTWQNGGKT
jgi:hypothetical protein